MMRQEIKNQLAIHTPAGHPYQPMHSTVCLLAKKRVHQPISGDPETTDGFFPDRVGRHLS
jgi:hypothetical protein